MIDFSNCKVDYLRAYDGANGQKTCVFYNGERYMLKFPSLAKNNPNMHYTNGVISEHVASSIYRSLDIDTQETLLGLYKGKEVVACKDFCKEGERILSFGMIKNQYIDSARNGFGTELQSILEALDQQMVFDPVKLKERFWKMFAADALLGNFDRHNGNWGVIVNELTQEVRLAPVYDNGSCLYPQLTDEQMVHILNESTEIYNRIYVFPNSAVKENDKKINYFDFLSHTDIPEAIKAMQYVLEHYNEGKILDIIGNAEISQTKKDFYFTMISLRKEHILEKCLEQNRNTQKILDDFQWEKNTIQSLEDAIFIGNDQFLPNKNNVQIAHHKSQDLER